LVDQSKQGDGIEARVRRSTTTATSQIQAQQETKYELSTTPKQLNENF